MATNRAAENLQALLAATSVPETPNAQELLEQTERSRPRSTDTDADFAAPEALVTAVASSFILGPIGGLLLGAAQGILGEQMRQGQLDAVAAEANALAEADEIVSATFAQQRAGVTDPLDLQQLNTIQSQYDAARKMLQSPFEETKQRGAALLSAALQAQREFDVRQEEQFIAAVQADETARRELGQENYNRYKQSIGRFTNESEGYLAVRQASKGVLAALQNNNPVSQMAAIKLLEKSLDPTSVVRPEEQEAYGAMGSLFEQLNARAQLIKTGKPLLPKQVDQIEDLVMDIDQIATDFQLARQMRFKNEITDIELPEKYHDNFVLTQRSIREELAFSAVRGFMSDRLGRPATDEEANSFWRDLKEFAKEDSVLVDTLATGAAAAGMILEAEITKWVAGGALAGGGLLGGGHLVEKALTKNGIGRPLTEAAARDPKLSTAVRRTGAEGLLDAEEKLLKEQSKLRRIGGNILKWARRLGLIGLGVDAINFLTQQGQERRQAAGFSPSAPEVGIRGKLGLPLLHQQIRKQRPTN